MRRYVTPTPPAIGQLFVVLLSLVGGAVLAIRGWRGWLDHREYVRQRALAEPKPPDRQMDRWLADDIEQIKHRAADRLRLDVRTRAERGGGLLTEAQVIVGIPDRDLSPRRRVRVRYGADRRIRSNRYNVLIVYLATNLIATYQCVLDFHTGQITIDRVREHQYRHVVGVSSASVPMPEELADAVELVSTMDESVGRDRSLAQTFTLSIGSGEQLSVYLGYGHVQQTDGKIAWNNDNSLAVIQRMVRTRSGGF